MRELLAREQQRHIEQQNETLRIALTAFASEEPRTLDDLLAPVDRDWSVRSSERPSGQRHSRAPSPRSSDTPRGPFPRESWGELMDNESTQELQTRDIEYPGRYRPKR